MDMNDTKQGCNVTHVQRSESLSLYAAKGLPAPTAPLTLPTLLQKLEFTDELKGNEGDGAVWLSVREGVKSVEDAYKNENDCWACGMCLGLDHLTTALTIG
jgi:hypothetical protein